MTATHSMTSTYFGNITIVLKFPFTRAASTNGLHRYSGFCTAAPGDGGTGDRFEPSGYVADVGVGERFGARGARLSLRLPTAIKAIRDFLSLYGRITHPKELKKLDIEDGRRGWGTSRRRSSGEGSKWQLAARDHVIKQFCLNRAYRQMLKPSFFKSFARVAARRFVFTKRNTDHQG